MARPPSAVLAWATTLLVIVALKCSGVQCDAAVPHHPVEATWVHRACLRPSVPRSGTVSFGDVPVSFCLMDLGTDSAYEVRISYPATTPAAFEVRVFAGAGNRQVSGQPMRGSARALLNVEKHTFRTDAMGKPVGLPLVDVPHNPAVRDAVAFVSVWARPEAVYPEGWDARSTVTFGILVDPLVASAVPSTAVPMILVVLLALVTAVSAAMAMLLCPMSPLFDPAVRHHIRVALQRCCPHRLLKTTSHSA